MLSESFDYYRDIRDAVSEAMFFSVYGRMFSQYLADRTPAHEHAREELKTGRQATFVKEAIAAIADGGYPEAVARAGALLARRGEPFPLARLQLKKELMADYKDLLPDLAPDAARRVRGEQEVIVTYEREAAIEAIPKLLRNSEDCARFLTLLNRLPADARIQADGVTPEQEVTLERIRRVLAANGDGSTLESSTTRIPVSATGPKTQGVRR